LKIYRVNCEAVVSILFAVLVQKSHLGKTIDNTLQSNKKLGAKDRHFIASSVFDIIRFLRHYTTLVGSENVSSELDVRHVLAAMFVSKKIEMPSWFEADDTSVDTIKLNNSKPLAHIDTASFTDFFYTQGEEQYGANWTKIADALNEEAAVCLRVNSLVTDLISLRKELSREGIETKMVNESPDALLLNVRKKLTNHPSYQAGCFEFQDVSSQQVVLFAKPTSGMKIVDACAGAGGKSLYLAQLIKNDGLILSLDLYPKKLETLTRRAAKAKASCISTYSIEDAFFVKHNASADLVIVDAPCSGSGVIKRNPENKWNLQADFIKNIAAQQLAILNKNAALVGVGGELLYATCSILSQENSEVVTAFLAQNKYFNFIEEKILVPGVNTSFDGFYMAKMKRIA
jgi:16S rRNA (cytosine967-C5)-methyltransferase